MRFKTKKAGLFLLMPAMALLFQACDYIANPYKPSTSSTQTNRKVLIEDYTGHKCGNCPGAARQLTTLEALPSLTGKIVPIAVHAGFYAAVTPSSNPPYPTDLTSQTATDWDNAFGNSAAGNPNGLINRAPSSDSASFIKQYSSWGTAVSNMINIPAEFQLTISNTYNNTSNQLTTSVTVKTLQSVSGTFNMSIVLTEDSIYGEQEDYSLPTGQQYITHYLFNHVLRTAINGSFGEPVFLGTISANSSQTITHANFQLNSNWKAKNCHVIAFIYDAGTSTPTKNQVFQVETKTLF